MSAALMIAATMLVPAGIRAAEPPIKIGVMNDMSSV
jgi:hypothetical protein